MTDIYETLSKLLHNDHYDYKFDASGLKDHELLFIRTGNGRTTHLAVDGITFCSQGAGLIAFWSRDYTSKSAICWSCKEGVRLEYDPGYLNFKINYYDSWRHYRIINRAENWKRYQVTWQCCAMVKKNSKKLKRCSKWAYSPYYNMCTQHKKYYLKYLHRYLSVCDDVNKLICRFL